VRFHVRLVVSLKDGLLDPQGKAVEGALPALGWDNVGRVSVGKYIRLDVDAPTEEVARQQVHQMAARFLTNPVIEDYAILKMAQAEEEEDAPAMGASQ
jgi:phosphoribosylformylglycinamidine synthase subunit PurS